MTGELSRTTAGEPSGITAGELSRTKAGEPSGITSGDVFAALASPARRELLQLLLGGTRTVNELAAHFDMRRPSVSEHLRVLKDAGLVSERKSGRQRHYQLEPRPLVDLQQWLHPYEKFWRDRMKALRDVLDQDVDVLDQDVPDQEEER